MKFTSLASSLVALRFAMAVPLLLAGCNNNSQAPASDTPPPAQTNTVDTVAPATNSADTMTAPTTPATPSTGMSSGTPVPDQSSKADTAVAPSSSSVTSPSSESSKMDTNAAPGSTTTAAPSQDSKNK